MYQLHIILDDQEHRHLLKQVKASGLSRSAFVRSLIMGAEIRPRPPTEYAGLLYELSKIGNNFNQLVRMVNATHKVTPAQIEDCRYMFNEMWRLVKDSF